jgi:hypothetical protein
MDFETGGAVPYTAGASHVCVWRERERERERERKEREAREKRERERERERERREGGERAAKRPKETTHLET